MTSLRSLCPIALTTAAAVVASLFVTPLAHADDGLRADEASVIALDVAFEQNAEFADSSSFTEDASGALHTDSGVTVEGTEVLLGEDYPNISLPVEGGVQGELAAGGTVVFDDAAPGLDIVIEATPDDVARVLTVADESYSDDAEHRYSYELNLPQGAILEQADDGNVVILAPAVEVVDEAVVDLTGVLPELEAGEEFTPLAEEVAAGADVASQEELGGDYEVPDGWEFAGAFQAPWSADAQGVSLPTHYEVDGTTVTQVVDTTGAEFPVVSDPLPLVAIGLGAIARALLPALFRAGAKALATQTIRAGVSATTKGGYRSFSAFKAAAAKTPKNNQWHHIVEQSNISKRGWDARWVHNRNNLVSIPKEVHQKCVNSWMAKKNVNMFGIKSGNKTMRATVHSMSFSKQHTIGVALLKHCGVKI